MKEAEVKTYRMEIEATIYVTIRAGNDQEAMTTVENLADQWDDGIALTVDKSLESAVYPKTPRDIGIADCEEEKA
jgi:hypothetical protein